MSTCLQAIAPIGVSADEALIWSSLRPFADRMAPQEIAPSKLPMDLMARERAAALIRRIATGDEDAMGELYDICAPTLMGVLTRMMRNEQEAEDVLQEAFITVWKNAATYKEDLSSPFAWLVMIARRRGIDRIRALQRVERTTEKVKAELAAATILDDHSCTEPLRNECNHIVRTVLRRLPQEQRDAIEMAFFKGLTYSEIAQQTSTPLGTVKARIRRGMERLRDLLREIQ
jgi:RNA polymerase sigma-70 factor (ECF subfamily)